MPRIERTLPADGNVVVENLAALAFNVEEKAHTFALSFPIEAAPDGPDFDESEATVRALFYAPEGTTIAVNGSIAWDSVNHVYVCEVTLTAACYAAQGRYLFTMYLEYDEVVSCIYACAGHVVRAAGDVIVTGETYPSRTLQDQITAIKQEILSAHLIAVFAQNIGEVESEVQTFDNTVAAIRSLVDETNQNVEDLLALNGYTELNGPNLLPYQPKGVSVYVPSGDVIEETITIPVEDATAAATTLTYTVTNENITANMVLHGIKSGNASVVNWTMVSGTASAGSMAVTVTARPDAHAASVTVTLYICAHTTALLPPGQEARYYMSSRPWLKSIIASKYAGDPGEEIRERVVTLTGSDIVTDINGDTYDTAVAFTVQNAPASSYNNHDILVFNHGTDGGTATREVDDGNGGTTTETYTYPASGIISELTDGEVYTLSCWARITSGSAARLVFQYGLNENALTSGVVDTTLKYIDITGSAWQRVTWTFVYNSASGAYKKRVGVGVCRKNNGTVQLCGFRLVHGGLYVPNGLDALEAVVNAQAATIATQASTIASQASALTSLTARVEALENAQGE